VKSIVNPDIMKKNEKKKPEVLTEEQIMRRLHRDAR